VKSGTFSETINSSDSGGCDTEVRFSERVESSLLLPSSFPSKKLRANHQALSKVIIIIIIIII